MQVQNCLTSTKKKQQQQQQNTINTSRSISQRFLRGTPLGRALSVRLINSQIKGSDKGKDQL